VRAFWRFRHELNKFYVQSSASLLNLFGFITPNEWNIVTHSFKIKIRCSSYVCPGSSCHTYGLNVNTENQCLKYINFIARILSLQRRLYLLSHRAAGEHTNPTCNWPGATHASRRSLHHRSPSHLYPLNSVTTRVSRLMFATQQLKGKHNNIYIYMQALNKQRFYRRKHPTCKVHLL
jgi:hypothetical protein